MAAGKASLSDAGLLLIRVSGAFMAIGHGWGKVSAGFSASKWGFVDAVRGMGFPMPELFAWGASLSELIGGLAIALGIYTRVSALAVACTMFVAAFIAHAGDPFQKKEMALLYLAISLGLVFTGGGRLTVDSFWRKG